jgi:hypothetical protein
MIAKLLGFSPWLLVAGALGVLAVAGGLYFKGWRDRGIHDGVADLKARIATLQFDVQEAKARAAQAEAQQKEIEADDAANQEKIRAAEAVLARGYGCPSLAELEWLSNIGKAGAAALGPSAAAQGCDPWPIIAARERAGRLKANAIIVKVRDWYNALRDDLARGRIPPAPAMKPQ